MSFAHDDHFGYLTTCPVNIGTGLKYNIFLKLPQLTKDMRLPALMKDLHLKMEEIMDPDAETFKDCIDVSNLDRIGKTEVRWFFNHKIHRLFSFSLSSRWRFFNMCWMVWRN